MGTATIMTYGDYNFSPVPLVTIGKTLNRVGDNTVINETTTLTLNGTLVASDNLAGEAGLDLIDAKVEGLRNALKTDCAHLLVKCDSTVIITCKPRIINFTFAESNNNWTLTVPFTVEMEFETELDELNVYPDNIKSSSENWTLEFGEENQTSISATDGTPYTMRLSHNVSAEGKMVCDSGASGLSGIITTRGWEEARDWVVDRLGFDSNYFTSGTSGSINIDPTGLGQFNHMRVNNMNEEDGNFSVEETWLLVDTSNPRWAGNALEDFTVNVQSSVTEPLITFNIEGSIQGLETKNYGTGIGDFNISEEKYTAASGYWDTIQGRLFSRVNTIAVTVTTARAVALSENRIFMNLTINIPLCINSINRIISFKC